MTHIKTSDTEDRQSRPAGSIVKEAIEENARILKEERDKLSKWEHNNDS